MDRKFVNVSRKDDLELRLRSATKAENRMPENPGFHKMPFRFAIWLTFELVVHVI